MISLDNQLKYKGYAADAKAVGDALGTKLDKNQGAGNAGKILGIGADGIVVPQDKPTYTLPQATADALGGIKADAATAEDTQVVRIGTDGKLRTKPTGGSSITVDSALSSTSTNPVQNKVVTAELAEKITAPTTAAVGQIIKVKTVDGTGKPTEWEAVDLPSGGGGGSGLGDLKLIVDHTIEEEVSEVTYTADEYPDIANLRLILVHIKFGVGTTTGWWKLLCGSTEVISGSGVPSATHYYGVAEVKAGNWFYNAGGSSNNAAIQALAAPTIKFSPSLGYVPIPYRDFPTLRLYGNDFTLPVGTVIKVWGAK